MSEIAKPKNKGGRPRTLAPDQTRIGVRLEARDLAVVDRRSQGPAGRSAALRDILRRYDALVAASVPELSARGQRLALSALQGALAEDSEGDLAESLDRTWDMSAASIRTAIRFEVEEMVPPSEIKDAWAEFHDLTDAELLALADVAQRYWSSSER